MRNSDLRKNKKLLFERPANLYLKRLQPNCWVCFNPDAYGGAVVVSSEIKDMIIKKYPIQNTDKQKAVIESLVKRGILYSPSYPNHFSLDSPRIGNGKKKTYWMHATNQCNLRCTYCYVNKNNETMDFEKAKSTIQKIITDCKEKDVSSINIKFAGGEPLLAFPLIEKIVLFFRKITSPEITIRFGMITNGTLITPTIARFLKDEKFSISVSLDGPQIANDKTRIYRNDSGSYQDIVRGINTLRSAGIDPLILTVVSPQNLKFLSEFMNWLIDVKLSSRFSLSRDASIFQIYTLEEYNGILVHHLSEAYEVLLRRLPTRRVGDFHNLGNLSFERPVSQHCGVGISGMAITHKGLYASCQETLDKAIEAGHGSHLNLFRNRSMTAKNLDDFQGCGECQWRRVCAGDCIELKQKLWNRWDCPSPYCQTFKAIIPKLIDLRGWQLVQLRKEVNYAVQNR